MRERCKQRKTRCTPATTVIVATFIENESTITISRTSLISRVTSNNGCAIIAKSKKEMKKKEEKGCERSTESFAKVLYTLLHKALLIIWIENKPEELQATIRSLRDPENLENMKFC